MKKVFFMGVVLGCLVMIIMAADFRQLPPFAKSKAKNSCVGYTIIEYGKGIDCHGDTIRLVKRNGFTERYRDI